MRRPLEVDDESTAEATLYPSNSDTSGRNHIYKQVALSRKRDAICENECAGVQEVVASSYG